MPRGEDSNLMVMAERRERIVDFINSEGSVTFTQLKTKFPDVSEMTLRTDLKALDQQRQIIRVHGGAKSVGYAIGTDDLLARRATRRSDEKEEIARKAAALVTPGHTIFIDSGSTTTAFATALEDMDLMVFTNSITVASELCRNERIMTYMIGGRINRFSKSTTGGRAVESVREIAFDQVFLGVTGYQRGRGFMCGSDDEAVFKATLVSCSHERIALMDSSKEGRSSTFRFCNLEDLNCVVTDGGTSSDFAFDCDESKVKLL